MSGGPRIAGYEDLRLLGRGGFASVYRARQVAVGREVAVKVLDAPDPDERTRDLFTRECHAVGALSWHPHVVTVHDAGVADDGRLYLAMELLPGGSLDDIVAAGDPLQLSQSAGWMAHVSDALAAAHEIGLLHRDVKPANVLVDRRGQARLADFGIVRIAGATATASSTVGTVAYMAPEVLEGGRASPAGDVYALGLTLATLHLGENPFVAADDDSPFAVIPRVLAADGAPLPGGFPARLRPIVVACTARDRSRRPSAAEVSAWLAALAGERDGRGPQPPSTPVAPAPTSEPGRTGPGRGPVTRAAAAVPRPPTAAVRVRSDHTLAQPPPPPAPPPPPRSPPPSDEPEPETPLSTPAPLSPPSRPRGRGLLVAVGLSAVLAMVVGGAVVALGRGGTDDYCDVLEQAAYDDIGMVVFLDSEVSPGEIDGVEQALAGLPATHVRYVDRDETFAAFRRLFAGNTTMLEIVIPEDLPTSFQMAVAGEDEATEVTAAVEDLAGVFEVQVAEDGPLVDAVEGVAGGRAPKRPAVEDLLGRLERTAPSALEADTAAVADALGSTAFPTDAQHEAAARLASDAIERCDAPG